MNRPRFSLIPVMDHEIHITEWGDPAKPAIVMWHGLARTGRDFDELAAALSDEFFVLCPDTIGRGLSSWSKDPEREYTLEYYTGIASDLMDNYNLDRVGWIGTSMGGLIGMRMASSHLADRLSWLIINDIGPEIPQQAIDRILTYVGDSPCFQTVSEVENWLRTVYTPFGPAADTFWRRMARSSLRRQKDGTFTTHYDPRIIVQFSASTDKLSSWDHYARITLPTHIICGAKSDILTGSILERMRTSGPKPGVTVFQDCGHAPSLSRCEDIDVIRKLIDSTT